MQKIILALLITLFYACNQNSKQRKVPEQIETAFKKLHPKAIILKWNDEPPIWEAKYQDNTEKGAVSFNSNAQVVETELVIAESDLQNLPSIPQYIKINYSAETIKGFEKVEKQNGTITYEIQITGKELIFDVNGKFLGEELD